MMAVDWYTFTGRVGEVIPQHVTHVRIAKSLKGVCARTFYEHPNIEEVECHDGVEKIEREAFARCPKLRRVIMPGVKVIESRTFNMCLALTLLSAANWKELVNRQHVSLRSVDLPSINIVGKIAFYLCRHVTSVNFGEELESIQGRAFYGCENLERIILPLRDGMIRRDHVFQGCEKLNRVDVVGRVHDIIAALL